ncbi:unnamed protein product [Ceutorhynchus assimilis]|uniref:C-CAP/cofactor C-like domain-containing protein n=1 Tax=Ceutorhynchus assimilis TaxID=467358 RepID=A0A9N9MN00_9CUCU|nr:unnamed protein product [Ceutorhynchus assimilis]
MSTNIAYATLSSIYNSSLAQYLKYSQTIGGAIFEQSLNVDNVFKNSLELVLNIEKYRKPSNPLAEEYLMDPLFREIEQVTAFETKASDHIFQITLISKSIKIFEWVRETDQEKFVSKLNNYIVFYKQKALCEIEHLGKTHFEWLKYWNETYEELSIFIANFFQNGVVWTGIDSLPMINLLGDSFLVNKSEKRVTLVNEFAQLESISNYKTPPHEESVRVFEKQENKWLIKNHKNSHNLVLNTAVKNEDVAIRNCVDSTIIVENLVNNISLENCKKVSVLFRNASKVEARESEDCNMHCFEKIVEIFLQSCDNCKIHLSDKSLGSSISTIKCFNINVNFPFDDGLYKSFQIADELRTMIMPNQGLSTTAIMKQ